MDWVTGFEPGTRRRRGRLPSLVVCHAEAATSSQSTSSIAGHGRERRDFVGQTAMSPVRISRSPPVKDCPDGSSGIRRGSRESPVIGDAGGRRSRSEEDVCESVVWVGIDLQAYLKLRRVRSGLTVLETEMKNLVNSNYMHNRNTEQRAHRARLWECLWAEDRLLSFNTGTRPPSRIQ